MKELDIGDFYAAEADIQKFTRMGDIHILTELPKSDREDRWVRRYF